MKDYIKPADRLVGCKLNNGWLVESKIEPINYSSCYIVKKDGQKGFLKAFDYSDLRKSGGRDLHKRLSHKFERELEMLRKCREKNIDTVIQLLEDDCYFFEEGNIGERVDYFILEFSEDGSVHDCLTKSDLKNFGNKFQALVYLFDGLNELHQNGIMHLDLKSENLVYFSKERLTKITDFGSARKLINDIDSDLLDDLNSIITTRHYAPPECLYTEYWTSDWYIFRRKVDLYLVGNIIVKLFTNFSFTTLLGEEISQFYHWDNDQNKGKLKQFLPYLISGANEVYVIIEDKLKVTNAECGMPLDNIDIKRLMKVIIDLCNPDAQFRGHPKELIRNNNNDGLYRYHDKFVTMRDKCEVKAK